MYQYICTQTLHTYIHTYINKVIWRQLFIIAGIDFFRYHFYVQYCKVFVSDHQIFSEEKIFETFSMHACRVRTCVEDRVGLFTVD
jgi:hypothetical protein